MYEILSAPAPAAPTKKERKDAREARRAARESGETGELSDDQWREKARGILLRQLTASDKTAKQLKDKLLDKDCPEEIADEVIVMKDGLVVESGPTARVLHGSSHAYTRALIDAVPCFDDSAVRTIGAGQRTIGPEQRTIGSENPAIAADSPDSTDNPTEPTGGHHA